MYVRLLGLLPLLASCSLINSYDDVVEGGAGAGNAGGGEPTTTTTGTGTGTTSTGMGGDNTGGGGGPEVAPLDCQLVGLPDQVVTLQAEVGQKRTFRDRGFAWQPNGDRLRFVALVDDELRGYEVATSSGQINGTWVLPDVDDMIDARTMMNNNAGILVTRRPPMFGDPIPVEFYSIGNQGFGGVGNFPVTTQTSDQGSVRGKFVHVGPEPNRIDLLLRTSMGPTQSVFYMRHLANGTNSMPVPITANPPFMDSEESNPAGLVRTTSGRIHAFIGEPDANGTAVRHWVFAENATTSGDPIPLGAPGALFLDAANAGDMVNVAMAQVTMTTLGAHLGKIPEAQLDNLMLSDLHPAKQFDSFLDIPTAGRPLLVNDMFPLFGPNQTKDKFMLILSRTTDGAVRFDDPEFLQPKSPDAQFGDLGLLTTDNPVINLGGVLYILYSERTNAGEVDEYDRVMMATVTCEPQQ
ncbi:MAG: hypothetical protein HOV80_03265 [Polyangiaceae bacterium]|nr:hypothetical protein [Polyangiaceae bacterium]